MVLLYPVHASLHTYYKLASNLMDLHRNYKDGKGEEAPSSKRLRSYSSTTDGGGGPHTSSYNPPKKKKDEGRGRTEGGHKEFRHWPPAASAYQQDRGYGYQLYRYDD